MTPEERRRAAQALGRAGGLASARSRMADAYEPLRRKIAQIAATASWGPAARAKRLANGRKRVAKQHKKD